MPRSARPAFLAGTVRRALPVAVAAVGLGALPLAARQPPPTPACAAPEARQFDFWVGAWTVRQEILARDGSWHAFDARSVVTRALDGCALVEHWRGTVLFFWEGMTEPEAIEGLSVRAWDPAAKVWAIHWMDSRNPRFTAPWVGGFADGTGTFTRTSVGPGGAPSLNRIRFHDIERDALRWELAVSSDDGATWTTVWRMSFTRDGAAPARP